MVVKIALCWSQPACHGTEVGWKKWTPNLSPNHVDTETVKTHARDLKTVLEEADLTTSKAFLRMFIKRIDIRGGEASIQYTLPMPPQGAITDRISVLPIDALNGAGGIRTPYLLTER
jgi:hypothetical protein